MFRKTKSAHCRPALKLSHRIAEEAQLLAEEKWIIETLKKIKSQRNGLQIERLHLESMRAKILESTNANQLHKEPDLLEPVAEVVVDASQIQHHVPPSSAHVLDNFNLNCVEMDSSEICNAEELNLSVTNSVFNTNPYGPVCDEEEEEEDMENCLIDMEMLMSGK